LSILHQTMAYASSVKNNLDSVWLECYNLSNDFPGTINFHTNPSHSIIRISYHIPSLGSFIQRIFVN
jgi:hypothetical protein